MFLLRLISTCSLVGVVALFATGCAKPVEATYTSQLVPAKGTVYLGDKPQPHVTVLFHPAQQSGISGEARTSQALTDSTGLFSLSTLPGGSSGTEEAFEGALPGVYKVTLSCWQTPDGQPYDPATATEGPMNVGATDIIPANYSSPERTPLEVTIGATGAENIELRVKSK